MQANVSDRIKCLCHIKLRYIQVNVPQEAVSSFDRRITLFEVDKNNYVALSPDCQVVYLIGAVRELPVSRSALSCGPLLASLRSYYNHVSFIVSRLRKT